MENNSNQRTLNSKSSQSTAPDQTHNHEDSKLLREDHPENETNDSITSVESNRQQSFSEETSICNSTMPTTSKHHTSSLNAHLLESMDVAIGKIVSHDNAGDNRFVCSTSKPGSPKRFRGTSLKSPYTTQIHPNTSQATNSENKRNQHRQESNLEESKDNCQQANGQENEEDDQWFPFTFNFSRTKKNNFANNYKSVQSVQSATTTAAKRRHSLQPAHDNSLISQSSSRLTRHRLSHRRNSEMVQRCHDQQKDSTSSGSSSNSKRTDVMTKHMLQSPRQHPHARMDNSESYQYKNNDTRIPNQSIDDQHCYGNAVNRQDLFSDEGWFDRDSKPVRATDVAGDDRVSHISSLAKPYRRHVPSASTSAKTSEIGSGRHPGTPTRMAMTANTSYDSEISTDDTYDSDAAFNNDDDNELLMDLGGFWDEDMGMQANLNQSKQSTTPQEHMFLEEREFQRLRLRLEEASIFLLEGESNIKFDLHPRNPAELQAFMRVHSTILKLVDLLAAIAIMGLAVCEWPAVNTPFGVLPPQEQAVIELGCLLVLLIKPYFTGQWMGTRRMLTRSRGWIRIGIILAACIECLMLLVQNDFHFRITRMLRPFFLIDSPYSTGVRRVLREIFQALVPIMDVLLLFMVFIFMFAMMAFHAFASIKDDPSFGSLRDSFVNLFILVTTANYPDVMMPSYSHTPWSFLFFAAFLIICLYFLQNLLLAVVYDKFRHEELFKFKKLFSHKRQALRLVRMVTYTCTHIHTYHFVSVNLFK